MRIINVCLAIVLALSFSNLVNAQCAAGQVELLLSVTPDNWGSETSWQFAGPGGAPIYGSGGPYTDGNRTPINVNVCVDSNDVVYITMFDVYGDGLCCSEGNGSYTVETGGVTVASGGSFGASETTLVWGTPDEVAPAIVVNNELNLEVGASKTISIDLLAATDAVVDDSLLTYTVTASPSNGQLENADIIGVSITSFTQQNIIDDKVQYVHDGGNAISDSFTFKVSDGLNELTGNTFQINISSITSVFSDLEDANKVGVYPNPLTSNLLSVQFDESQSNISVSVADVKGVQVASFEEMSGTEVLINTADWTSGFYYIRLMADGEESVFKVVKK